MKNILLTIVALLAFAGNSILCRYALKGDAIDASSFTVIRLFSGVTVLIVLVMFKNRGKLEWRMGSWFSSLFLFIYMITFSFAYISLETGVGALILFGFVQVTMVLVSLTKGDKLRPFEWAGLIIAFSGLTFLLLPSAAAPSLFGFMLMAISGIAWGFYTLAGKGSDNPLTDTANNFLRTIPFVVVLIFLTVDTTKVTPDGIILALISGAITSGLGYAVWYAALAGLSITQASALQLTVPIIAAFGGIIFSSEQITATLLVSSTLVLGGILLVILTKKSSSNN